MGFILARSAGGPICFYRGRSLSLGEACSNGPFADREDRAVVEEGLTGLMQMPSAGDLVIYGIGAAAGHVSYLPEMGAHAGPSPEELHSLPSSRLTRPSELYSRFMAYREERR